MIDFAKKNPCFGCRKFSEIYGIGKTSVKSILKDEDNIRKEFEIFEGTYIYLQHFTLNFIHFYAPSAVN